MKIAMKILWGIATGVLCLLLIGMIYFYSAFPKVGSPKQITVPTDAATIEYGKYLVEHVTACGGCHSERNWDVFGGPIIPGTYGKGGEVFDESVGVPGLLVARNTTPYNLANWTDGEIYRAMTTGVDKYGKALFPIMPYLGYNTMDYHDALAIIAYIRTLKPVAFDPPKSHLDFPMNLIVRTIPVESNPQPKPSPANKVKYGEYLVKLASCFDCHTPQIKGEPILEKSFAGGMEFSLPKLGTVRSANITPDSSTGIGAWTEENFVSQFKIYQNPIMQKPVGEGQFQTTMPWIEYSGMTNSDLSAIYSYLRTIKPVHNIIDKFTSKFAKKN